MQDGYKAQLPIILNFLDDARRIIEGGKNRRWEVFKWTVALNVLLATAALTQRMAPAGLALLTIAVSSVGVSLIQHYDGRMTSARDRARNLVEWIRTNASMEMYAVMGETELIPTGQKDTYERFFFYGTIGASALVVMLCFFLIPRASA
jgi:hypothetical protein